MLNYIISREYDPSMHWAAHQVLFKCVVEDDVAGLKAYVESGEDVNGANEEVSSSELFMGHLYYLLNNFLMFSLAYYSYLINTVDYDS